METIVRWMTSREASTTAIEHMARLIRARPSEGEPVGVRAARAQLVHHILRSLEARVRREDAHSRGASAKPDRDLRTAAWAAPLRENEIGFELLVDAVIRLRYGAHDIYDIPVDQLARHGLDLAGARRELRGALTRLRTLRPDWHTANATIHLGEDDLLLGPSRASRLTPEELHVQGEEQQLARHTLAILLTGEHAAPRNELHRSLLSRLSADTPENATELLQWTAREFGLTRLGAERFVRRLIHLASQAGLDWLATQCRPAPTAPHHLGPTRPSRSPHPVPRPSHS
ncbi:hypothetical protein [Sphaerisporangium sp. NPDC051011]|uniref:hypothetical protein n=1 Tax=Sphaerisporangium sp. NPDC051011 TaxID=3155792 RepID=UPI0033CC4BC5